MKSLFNKNIYLSVYFAFFTLATLYMLYKQLLIGYTKDSWQITEWLINYQGGFVRRGLAGEVILALYNYLHIHPYTTIMSLSLMSYLAVIAFITRAFIKKGYSIFILPFVFFLSNPVISEFWVRKDNLILLLFILIIYIAVKRPKLYLIYINVLFIIGLLIHESAFFICFPILILILMNQYKEKQNSNSRYSIKVLSASVLSVLPTLICLLLVVVNKGSVEIAETIWDSWKHIDFPPSRAYGDTTFPYTATPAAIGGIGYSLEQGLSATTNFLDSFTQDIYAPFLLLISICATYYILSNIHKLDNKILIFQPRAHDNLNISALLIIQFIAIFPLYILGCDYGRWVYFWVVSAFALDYLIPGKDMPGLLFNWFVSFTKNINNKIVFAFGNSKGTIILLSLGLGMCGSYWIFYGYVKTTSLYIVVSNFSYLFASIGLFIKSIITTFV